MSLSQIREQKESFTRFPKINLPLKKLNFPIDLPLIVIGLYQTEQLLQQLSLKFEVKSYFIPLNPVNF